MNTSINYSGFVDLLGNSILESNSGACQKEDVQEEPAMDVNVEQLAVIRHALTAVTGPDW